MSQKWKNKAVLNFRNKGDAAFLLKRLEKIVESRKPEKEYLLGFGHLQKENKEKVRGRYVIIDMIIKITIF